jgi:hypothetical protein
LELTTCAQRITKLPVLILVSARPGFHRAFGNQPNLTRLPLSAWGGRDCFDGVGMTHGKGCPESC